jgi:DNA-binding NtrC family response regulator
MKAPLQIMILDDEPIVGKRLAPLLAKIGAEVEVFEDPRLALERIRQKTFDIVVTDVRMEHVSGIEILEEVKARSERSKVIMITAYATVELAREALSKGAFDFVAKPFKRDSIGEVVIRAAEALGLREISSRDSSS